MESNNKAIITLLLAIIVILVILCGLFATGTISFNNNSTNHNQQTNDNNQQNTSNDNVIQTKLVNNLNCNSSETTFNGITVKVDQKIEDMICSSNTFTINNVDITKENGHGIDSYEFFDNNIIIMSHTTSGPIFTIYNVTSNSIIKKYSSSDASLEGYYVKSYSTNNNIITINAEGCEAQCGDLGIKNAGTKAVFEIEYSNNNFSTPKLISKTNSNE